jgi:hypothetical protein
MCLKRIGLFSGSTGKRNACRWLRGAANDRQFIIVHFLRKSNNDILVVFSCSFSRKIVCLDAFMGCIPPAWIALSDHGLEQDFVTLECGAE